MTSSGWTGPRRRRWGSWRGGWRPTRSGWCSRPASRARSWPGCRSWRSGGCAEDDARALLDSALTGPLDARVRDRIVAETRGNPLALLELPRGLTPAELAGGFGLPRRGAADRADRGELPAAAGGACRTRPGGCCCWRRPSRPATRCWCGGRPGGSGSPGSGGGAGGGGGAGWSSARGCGSGIRWCARRPTGRRRSRTGSRCTRRWRR